MPNLNGYFEYDDQTLYVSYFYDKGESSVLNYGDGSGYPGSDPEILIHSIISDEGVNLMDYFTENKTDMNNLCEIILDNLKS